MIGNLGLTRQKCQSSFINYDKSLTIYEQGPFPPQILDDDGNLVDQIPETLQKPNATVFENGYAPQKMKF